jgi:hypothetical protein
MSYKSKNYKDILIFKTSVGIWIVYLFSFFSNWADKWFYAGGASVYYRTVGILESLFTLGIFIFQFFLIWRLIMPKKTKIPYSNYEVNFYPVFKNPYEKKAIFSFYFICFNFNFN